MEGRSTMTESNVSGEAPRYMVRAFATAETAQEWLCHCAQQAYHLVSMSITQATNDFSKEIEGLMWVVVERDQVTL